MLSGFILFYYNFILLCASKQEAAGSEEFYERETREIPRSSMRASPQIPHAGTSHGEYSGFFTARQNETNQSIYIWQFTHTHTKKKNEMSRSKLETNKCKRC